MKVFSMCIFLEFSQYIVFKKLNINFLKTHPSFQAISDNRIFSLTVKIDLHILLDPKTDENWINYYYGS